MQYNHTYVAYRDIYPENHIIIIIIIIVIIIGKRFWILCPRPIALGAAVVHYDFPCI